ncbi:MAG: Gldg family protein [Alphaproteobacteria bacterium]|nr:Gldg family protein [Alphaproteobacteria bacterium]
MSGSVILYLAGMVLVFAGQRLLGDGEALSMGLSVLGVALVLGAVGARVRRMGDAPTEAARDAHRKALLATAAGALSLVIYALSTDTVAEALLSDEEALKRWSVSWQAVWPIVWLLGTAPMLLIDLAIQDNAQVVQPVRVRQAVDNGLVMALGLALVFPLNYLAKEYNKRWDLAYFKTTAPGDSTRAIVENLSDPVVVRVFLPTSSDVTAELMGYFNQLQGPNLTVELLDHAAEPALAKDLKVRDNGYIAVTVKDGTDDAATKSWKVGDELDSAKRNLKKLDSEFRKRLLDLAKGKRTIYFTVGHDELNWRGGDLPEDKLTGLKKVLQAMNFKVEELGLTAGLGTAVPDDAAMVFVVGPKEPFLDGEIETLQRYVDAGGKLFIALEPDGEHLDGLLPHIGLKLGEGTLASATQYLRRSGDISDQTNVVTDRYSSHESTSNLSRYSKQLPMVTPGAGWLEEVSGGQGKVTIAVRSDDSVWADLDGDLKLGDGEEKKIRPIAAVVTGGDAPAPKDGEGDDAAAADDDGFRAMVIADATAISDLAIAFKGNQVYLIDGIGWLLGEAELGGSVESEEDVKIEHTREDQVTWFYGTIVGIPLLVLIFGVVRNRRRMGGVS